VSENNCLPNFDEIWYRNCLQKVVEQVWVLWKLVSGIFYLGWIKIETGDAHKHLVNVVCFMKIGLVKAELYSGP
jgi:hypothetical protein